jgi:hypothetical protein
MTSRFYQRCLLWLLPLLVVHSLVPVGFMVAAGERGPELAFCPVQSSSLIDALSQPRAKDHSQHHGTHAMPHTSAASDASQGEDHSEHARSNTCPFALAGSPMLTAAASALTITFLPVEILRPSDALTPRGVLRFERTRIRGPPLLA